QTLLFLPIHEENGEPPSRNPDRDLSPTLRALLNAPQAEGVTRFQPSATTWIPLSAVPTRICVDHLDARPGLPELEARLQQAEQHATEVLSHLELFKRARLQTSYTGLSRHLDSDRNLDHGQEPDPEPIPDQPSTQIPRGRQAGNALHEILEHALLQKSLDWVGREEPPQVFQDFARTRLEENRLPQESLSPILQIVERALDCSYELPGGTSVRLASLPLTDRRPETEFHLGVEPDWIHGFMDLVFRLDDRYYVLDWKSNSLPEFTEERIAQSMKADHYDLQAKLYCHALHRHLQGLLGTRYQPAQQLGFAVYVYLRAFETHSTVPIWTHAADPQADAAYVQTLMRQYREGT
ncbi:MAG TPA: PD-(D/E)XK nuclease family protein, partial [Fibrobacteraceae bacterium]|nr:PD-(D/E)XK nuclease family protein [Fibrobacteraceae bacterium]